MKIRFLSLAALILLTPALSSAQQAIHDDKYKPVTRENLSQLYWRMGAMDIKNDSDIDNFIMLNRCDIYEESYQDDLAWHEIRKKARVSIAKNQDKFSRYLKVIRPISLGRYNPDTEEFALTRPVATTNFEIRVSNENTWDCNRHATTGNVWRYPHQGILKLSAPLELYTLPVEFNRAQRYLETFPANAKGNNRNAVLVKEVKVFDANAHHGNSRENGEVSISATVENIYVYADKNMTMELYRKNLRPQRKKPLNNAAQ